MIFFSGFKRGKYFQETLGKALKEFQSSPTAIKHAERERERERGERRRFEFPEMCNAWELISNFLS